MKWIIKSILLFLLLSLSILYASAEENNYYTTEILDKNPKAWEIQKKLQNLSDEQKDYIINFFDWKKAGWEPLKREHIEEYLQDNKFWKITKCAAELTGNIANENGAGCVMDCTINIAYNWPLCPKHNWSTGSVNDAPNPRGWVPPWAKDITKSKKPKKPTEITPTDCTYDASSNLSVSDALKTCIAWESWTETQLVAKSNMNIETGFKESLLDIVKKVGGFLALGAIFSIAYWALLITLSVWEDDKIKKAKDIIKWWILWFLAIISAGFFIALVVNLIYWLAW